MRPRFPHSTGAGQRDVSFRLQKLNRVCNLDGTTEQPEVERFRQTRSMRSGRTQPSGVAMEKDVLLCPFDRWRRIQTEILCETGAKRGKSSEGVVGAAYPGQARR